MKRNNKERKKFSIICDRNDKEGDYKMTIAIPFGGFVKGYKNE